MKLQDLRIRIYADGADLDGIRNQYAKSHVRGLTTNPSLMRKAGVTDYERFAREALEICPDKPISFEVLSDEFPEMVRQGERLASWGENVFVKIPITNTRGESSASVIRALRASGVKVNVTAITNSGHINSAIIALASPPNIPAILSVFAGRIADTGESPEALIRTARFMSGALVGVQILWASTREVLNITQANDCGCHIITVPNDILAKAEKSWGDEDTNRMSLDVVRMFAKDAAAAGYAL